MRPDDAARTRDLREFRRAFHERFASVPDDEGGYYDAVDRLPDVAYLAMRQGATPAQAARRLNDEWDTLSESGGYAREDELTTWLAECGPAARDGAIAWVDDSADDAPASEAEPRLRVVRTPSDAGRPVLPAILDLWPGPLYGVVRLPGGTVLVTAVWAQWSQGPSRALGDDECTVEMYVEHVEMLDPAPWPTDAEAWDQVGLDWAFYAEDRWVDVLGGATFDWYVKADDIETLLRPHLRAPDLRRAVAAARGRLEVDEIVPVGSRGRHGLVEIVARTGEPPDAPGFDPENYRLLKRRLFLETCPRPAGTCDHAGRRVVVARTDDEVRTRADALLREVGATPRSRWVDELAARFDVVAPGVPLRIGWYGPERPSDRFTYASAAPKEGPVSGPVEVGGGQPEPGDVLLPGGLVLRTDPATGGVRGAWLRRRPWRRRARRWLPRLTDAAWSITLDSVAADAPGRAAARRGDVWAGGRVDDVPLYRVGDDLWLAIGSSGAVAGWVVRRGGRQAR